MDQTFVISRCSSQIGMSYNKAWNQSIFFAHHKKEWRLFSLVLTLTVISISLHSSEYSTQIRYQLVPLWFWFHMKQIISIMLYNNKFKPHLSAILSYNTQFMFFNSALNESIDFDCSSFCSPFKCCSPISLISAIGSYCHYAVLPISWALHNARWT